MHQKGLMSIFKTYDIRAHAEDITPEITFAAGVRFCQFIQNIENKKEVQIVIGQDMRPSSPEIAQNIIQGIVAAGGTALDMGLCSTPMNYYALQSMKADGSAMVTASHNPVEYNGIKFCRKGPVALSADNGLKDIEQAMSKPLEELPQNGKEEQVDVTLSYIDFMKEQCTSTRKLKIVIDAGNGMAGLEIPEFQKHFPNLEIIPLYFDLDGHFPNHDANPSDLATLKDLQQKVVEEKADFGCAFDGDADRLGGFVDENGSFL